MISLKFKPNRDLVAIDVLIEDQNTALELAQAHIQSKSLAGAIRLAEANNRLERLYRRRTRA